jgi:hypothetical protein
MNKLTIQHLSAYLPYELGFECEGDFNNILHGIHGNAVFNQDADDSGEGCYGIEIIKPILRPLSDLTKEIEHNGERFVPIEYFEIGDDDGYCYEFDHGNINLIKGLKVTAEHNIYHDLQFLPYAVAQKLIEWHFDFQGLIPQNLAIDLNTLQQ